MMYAQGDREKRGERVRTERSVSAGVSMEMVWDWKSIGSLLATLMFLRTALRDFLPPEVQQILRAAFSRLITLLQAPSDTILIEEYEASSPNELYESAQSYLGSRCLADAPVVRLSKSRRSPHPTASLPTSHTTTDTFDGISMRWESCSVDKPRQSNYPFSHHSPSSAGSEQRSLRLSFPRRHRDAVFSRYIPMILDEAAKLRLKCRERRLYTNRGGGFMDDGHRQWTHVPFTHPSTFDTLALDTQLKNSLRNDLSRFSARRDHYARAGRAWKRGYLLHGPPGTGKTSLVAAIANLLEFDVYDLELTAVHTNTQLRSLLVSTTPKSVVVVEDVDCSLDLSDRKKRMKKKKKNPHHLEYELESFLPTSPEEEEEEGGPAAGYRGGMISLSGVLNFVDGLWSSCVGERIMIFTTNHPERLDPALLRPGRMDRMVHLSFCGPEAFRVLARNYLEVEEEGHELMAEAEALLGEVEVTPAEVAEVFMGCESDGADAAMRRVVDELQRRKAAKAAPAAAEATACSAHGGSDGSAHQL